MTHPLENNLLERARFNATTSTSERAAWRRAVELLSGSLPTWAERKRNGLRPSFPAAEAVALYRAGGVTLKQVARHYGVTPQAIGHHVRKAGLSSTVNP
jgi:hypothetical protein